VNCKPLLRDTRIVNLAVVPRECHTGKYRGIEKINQVIGNEVLTSCFLENLGA